MKKFLSLTLAILMLAAAVPALAEVDLSGMSFGELIALKDRINKALWESTEWQEVTVPQGVYVVGEDIPAGHWTITPAAGQYATVQWGDTLDESKQGIAYSGKIYEYELLTSETYRHFEEGEKTHVDYDVKDGQYIIIDSGSMVFTPYAGKPDLGFKK